MKLNRVYPQTALKSGMSLTELAVVMAAFLLSIAILMIGASTVKEGASRPVEKPKLEKAPRKSPMPTQIAGVETGTPVITSGLRWS
jgi:hypothetical protein